LASVWFFLLLCIGDIAGLCALDMIGGLLVGEDALIIVLRLCIIRMENDMEGYYWAASSGFALVFWFGE
jgi:hypothetical protein